MTNMPGAGHAARLARESPGLGIGVHLVLTCGRPLCLTTGRLSIQREVFAISHLSRCFTIDADEVYREWKRRLKHASTWA
ncbi:ChbG/HpnK family deacetylase [Bacillus licheniformis]|nr:ChbG/HpnK family deacetylase [Bacillus licheniformis]